MSFIAQLLNFWKRPFLIWEYNGNQYLKNVTESVQTPFTTLLTVRFLLAVIAFVQLFAQIITDIFVSNFLLFCFIRNPTEAITFLSGELYSANIKLVKTTFVDMGITIEITTSNNVTRTCANTIYNTANGALPIGINCLCSTLRPNL